MCPETGLDDENDVFIDYHIGGSYDVYPESLFGNDVSIVDHFGGDPWILPYDQYYVVTPVNQRADYFLSLQSPASLQSGSFFLYRDALVRGAVIHRTWEINDAEVRFSSSKKLIVEGTLLSNGATFTASGANWGGLEFKSGSEGVLQNVDVLKVGSGAYTGAMTIRNGADVVIEDSDQIILGPTFVAELGSTFSASIEPGLSKANSESEANVGDDAETPKSEGFSPQAYPNPFSPSTTIQFYLEKAMPGSVKVYDVLGREVATIVSGDLSGGINEYAWDGRNHSGEPQSSGLYIYVISAGGETESGRIVLVR
jgi:hypothetical protein